MHAHKYTGAPGAPRARTGAAGETPAARGRRGAFLPGPRRLRGDGICFGLGLGFFSPFWPLEGAGCFSHRLRPRGMSAGCGAGSTIRPPGPAAEAGRRGRGRKAADSGAVPAVSADTSGHKNAPKIWGALGRSARPGTALPAAPAPLIWVLIRSISVKAAGGPGGSSGRIFAPFSSGSGCAHPEPAPTREQEGARRRALAPARRRARARPLRTSPADALAPLRFVFSTH